VPAFRRLRTNLWNAFARSVDCGEGNRGLGVALMRESEQQALVTNITRGPVPLSEDMSLSCLRGGCQIVRYRGCVRYVEIPGGRMICV
jgi:hypothetical protein